MKGTIVAKEITKENVIAIIFLLLIIFYLLSILFNVISASLLVKVFANENQKNTRAVEFTKVDWEALYPFENETSMLINRDGIKNLDKTAEILKDKVDRFCTEKLLFRVNFFEMNTTISKLLDRNIIEGSENVVKMKNGYLTYYNELADVTECAEQVIRLKEYAEGSGAKFLYVQYPFKVSKYDDQMPDGVEDYSNENADNLLKKLLEGGVDTYDFRETINNKGLDHYSLFFETDHHWKTETGLWVASELAALMNQDYGYNIDTSIYEPNNYDVEVYENWSLGTQGKKVGLSYTDPENISLITPKFDTSLQLQIPSKKVNNEGRFEDVVYNMAEFERIDYYKSSPYDAHLYENNAVSLMHNNKVSDGKKMLILKESFSLVVLPYLALGVEDIEVLDVRKFTGSVKTYIKESKPNMVLVMYNPSFITGFEVGEHTHLFDLE
ncbi:MAG: hypothetical protein CVV02_03965 [Firmicutes bacterium HGW-Firmicutes-7]|nr:MAG: hypothetical protein CVV02_03965 [Firmicutes bacterium HGW-Firmicutes-7]